MGVGGGGHGGFSYLQGQVGVFLLLAHLQTGQVGVLQLQAVLVFEVLSHRALHRLPVL